MTASDKAHLRTAAERGECTKEYSEQLIREAEQREAAERQRAQTVADKWAH
jgi:hypothetical protein